MQIISIQSHVAYGHVGNAAIELPLQRLGIDVVPVHTTLLSSHKGYPATKGHAVEEEKLKAIIDGLDAIGVLNRSDAVLSGYLATVAAGQIVLDTARRVKAANPKALFCCDPVIGDRDEGVYVSDDVREFLIASATNLADVITPNHFELGLLSSQIVRTQADVETACQTLRARGPEWVLATSLHLDTTPGDRIEMQLHGRSGKWTVQTPVLQLAHTVKGAGDVTAALFTGHLLRGSDPVAALEKTTAGIFAVLAETARLDATELRLVRALDLLLNPAESFPAAPIT